MNKVKTGGIGSLGKGKWNKETCYTEAQKYHSRADFAKGKGSAYNVAKKKQMVR